MLGLGGGDNEGGGRGRREKEIFELPMGTAGSFSADWAMELLSLLSMAYSFLLSLTILDLCLELCYSRFLIKESSVEIGGPIS